MRCRNPRSTPLETDMGATTLDLMAALAGRSQRATDKGAQAFARLLKMAEQGESGQPRRVAQFVAATFNGRSFPFDLFELRAVDVEVSDDMIRCVDALRWGRADLYRLVPDGEARVRAVIRHLGLGRGGQG